jgi:SulP family sulfate permease
VIGNVAMPALGGLLLLIGIRTVKPYDLASVWKTSLESRLVLLATFVLTLVIPLQYAVITGVGLSAVLYIVGQANRVTVKRRVFTDDGHMIETEPPAELGANDVVVLQPYGSLFFAAAPVFEAALPNVAPGSRNSVLILRLRERSDVGSTFIDVLRRLATSLHAVGSKLVIVSVNDRLADQLRITGLAEQIGLDNLYAGTERVGAALERAYQDSLAWVATRETLP